ncbi:diguanylate cyclase domain-containing protein [Thalassomonas sp. M1454]|uniref:diguanylate cyclase domain-containing protein n=1 Tax=Thalassomonas sp. M1454 TaxID=2594477 RepID=UPI00117D9191|nr:diguanylate cyclase [Thalassomonas sp. M1454]TRX56971.1 diguanylate cyclase [Thalassomonas sp. M1454]
MNTILHRASKALQYISDGICIVDLDGRYSEVNSAFTNITGYSQEELIGQSPRILKSGVHDSDFYKSMWDAIHSKGIWKGEICNRRKNGSLFFENITITKAYDDQGEPSHYAAVLSDITEKKSHNNELYRMAHYDQLTNLANRVSLTQKLDEYIACDKMFTLFFIDIDDFKSVNDNFGHIGGDEVLKILSHRLKSEIRATDMIARFGGDEFIIISEETNAEVNYSIAERLLMTACSPMQIGNQTVSTSISIGISTPRVATLEDSSDLIIRQADQAMYQAKKMGKNCIKWFSESQEDSLSESTSELIAGRTISMAKREAIRTQILEMIMSGIALRETLRKIVQLVELDYPGMLCSILLLDDSKEHLVGGIAPSLPKFYNEQINGIKIGKGIGACGNTAFTGTRTIIEDISTHPYWKPFAPLAAKANLGACWSEPIYSGDKKVLGTFAIYHAEKSIPVEDDFKLINMSARLAAMAIEKDKLTSKLWRNSNFDVLTKLPNEQLLKEHIRKQIKTTNANDSFTLFFIDIKNLSHINDKYGYNNGNAVLKEIAKRLEKSFGDHNTIARISGDEFAILSVNNTVNLLHTALVKKIEQVLNKPHNISDVKVSVGFNMGSSNYPSDASDEIKLVQTAASALQKHKKSNVGYCHCYDQAELEASNDLCELTTDLTNAIKTKQLSLVYQPIVDFETKQVVKVEALARWNHPKRGPIGPDIFVPLAEKNNLAIKLGEFVIDESLKALKLLHEQHNLKLKISINTSALQYSRDYQLAEFIEKTILKYKVCADCITIELTETALAHDLDVVYEQLLKIKKLGVKVAIDDFGTGYSSLSYLQKLDFDFLKIDKVFIKNMADSNSDTIMCEAMIAMASKLGIDVIVEGVETNKQATLLKELSAQYGQGYLFSKPLPMDDLNRLLEQRH